MQPFWQYSACELARAIAQRECSAREVVEAHLDRIEQVNPAVNAVVRVMQEEARAAATSADESLGRGERVGPLHGVPFSIKENIDVAGLPTTWGVPALSQAVVPQDAPVVARLRAAGAIPIARTNLPDMGLRMVTESSLYGITRNPWNPELTAGGSSGGEAAALATGMTPLGIGNDLGGSLRNPASACGVVSIRPSAGRIPHAGFVPVEDQLLSTRLMLVQGPMARSVADVRLALQVMIGAHPRDPWSISAPFDGDALPGRIRVALLPAPPGGTCDPAISAAVRTAADALANAGYDVVEACPPRYEEAISVWAAVLATDFGSVLERILPLMGPQGRAFAQGFIGHAAPASSVRDFSRLFMERDGIARAWALFMAKHPLLLTPTWTQLPFAHGFDVQSEQNGRAVLELVRPVLPANLLGLPSACVPAALDRATGLPIGVLLTGQRFREDVCLRAAEHIEAQSGVETPIRPRTVA